METTTSLAGAEIRPRLRENIWHLDPGADTALLITGRATFEVATSDALKFFRMRPHCNGHHPVEEIARRAGLPVGEARDILRSLEEVDVVRPATPAGDTVSAEEVRDVLTRAALVWGQELQLGYIGNDFLDGALPRTALIGWLLETYHYIKDCPAAIAYGARLAEGELRDVLLRYEAQERGHEIFVLRTLVNLGMTREEVEASSPLVSTRLLGFLMRDLFQIHPAGVLAMAALVEAREFDEEALHDYEAALVERYAIPKGALQPLFEHQRIDVAMDHSKLLASNLHLVDLHDRAVLDRLVNGLHDLKHGFDLQALEIAEYYGNPAEDVPAAMPLPRQAMDSLSI